MKLEVLHVPDHLSVDTDRSTGQVLAALHDADAIRLARDGQIAVAYPFSATPTSTGSGSVARSMSMRCAPSTRSASPPCSAQTR
jgi:hypothetical protein